MSSPPLEGSLPSRAESVKAFARWRSLNQEIVRRRLSWREIKQDLLELISETDALWRDGKITAGVYRQKGNLFRDTVISLVEARCGQRVEGRKVDGRSDKHVVDLAATELSEGKPVLVLAGETKMIGSPAHADRSERYPERTISIDIDKRTKEVKYTPVDLKRVNDSEVSGGWSSWLGKTKPMWVSAWLCRLASKDNLLNVQAKFESLREYNNAVAVAIYRDRNGVYEWVRIESSNLLDLDELTELICGHLKEMAQI